MYGIIESKNIIRRFLTFILSKKADLWRLNTLTLRSRYGGEIRNRYTLTQTSGYGGNKIVRR